MKTLISTAILSLILASSTTLACQGFNGTWTCQNGQVVQLNVQQNGAYYNVVDANTGATLILDGASHSQSSPFEMTYTGTCNDSEMNISISAMGMNIIQNMTLTSPNSVVVNASANGQSGQTTCTK